MSSYKDNQYSERENLLPRKKLITQSEGKKKISKLTIQYNHKDGTITNDHQIVSVKQNLLPIKDKKDFNMKMEKFTKVSD